MYCRRLRKVLLGPGVVDHVFFCLPHDVRIFSENKVKGFGILDYAGKRRYGSVFGSVGEKLFTCISQIYLRAF